MRSTKQIASPEIIAEDFYSPELLRKVRGSDPDGYSYLIQTAKEVQKYFKRFRAGRLINDTVPRHESVTPKKATRCTLTVNQCRTLLLKALHLVFKFNIGSNQQFYKIVCLIIKILFSHVPCYQPTLAQVQSFKQLLHTKLHMIYNVSPLFRKELSKNCILYLTTFCCNIMSYYFYATLTKTSAVTHVVFYRRSVWNKIQKFAFKQLSVRQGLKKIELDTQKPVSRLRILPKKGGIRPIGVALNKFDPQQIRNVLLVLRYLCATMFPNGSKSPSLSAFRRNFPKMVERFKDAKQIYYCTGDLIDCFNKIDYTVISNFLSVLGLDDVFHVVTKSDNRYLNRLCYGVGKSTEEAKNNLETINGSIVFGQTYARITGHELRQLVRDYAFRPQVYFAGNCYRFSRGVLQGSPLSSILNEIYLLTAEKMIFGNHVKNGHLIYHRHVDDYIFFSDNKRIMTSTIVKLLDGNIRFRRSNTKSVAASIPRFNSAKVLVNFNNKTLSRFDLQRTNFFPFCGTVINLRHNSISIDYKRYERKVEKIPVGQRIIMSNRLHAVRTIYTKSVMFTEHRREHSKRQFLSFIFNKVLLQRADDMNMKTSKRSVRLFIKKQLTNISKKLGFKLRRLEL